MCLSYLMLYKFLWKFPCLLRCLSMWSTTSITCTMCTMCTLCMWYMVPWRNAAFSTDEKFLPYLDLLKFRNVGKRLESKPNPVNLMIIAFKVEQVERFQKCSISVPPRRMEHRASAWDVRDVRVSEFCDEDSTVEFGDAVCGDATGALFWATTCDLLPGQSTIAGLRHGRHGLMPTGAAVKRRCSGRNRNARNGRNGDRELLADEDSNYELCWPQRYMHRVWFFIWPDSIWVCWNMLKLSRDLPMLRGNF